MLCCLAVQDYFKEERDRDTIERERDRKRERDVSITELQAEKCCMCAAIEKRQLKKIMLLVI